MKLFKICSLFVFFRDRLIRTPSGAAPFPARRNRLPGGNARVRATVWRKAGKRVRRSRSRGTGIHGQRFMDRNSWTGFRPRRDADDLHVISDLDEADFAPGRVERALWWVTPWRPFRLAGNETRHTPGPKPEHQKALVCSAMLVPAVPHWPASQGRHEPRSGSCAGLSQIARYRPSSRPRFSRPPPGDNSQGT